MARAGIVVEVEALCRCRLAVLVDGAPDSDAARADALAFLDSNPAAWKHARPKAVKPSWNVRPVGWHDATEHDREKVVVRAPAGAATRGPGG